VWLRRFVLETAEKDLIEPALCHSKSPAVCWWAGFLEWHGVQNSLVSGLSALPQVL
jgi:hypothetical protein